MLILPMVPKDRDHHGGLHGNRQSKNGCGGREPAGHLMTFHLHYREESESGRA